MCDDNYWQKILKSDFVKNLVGRFANKKINMLIAPTISFEIAAIFNFQSKKNSTSCELDFSELIMSNKRCFHFHSIIFTEFKIFKILTVSFHFF